MHGTPANHHSPDMKGNKYDTNVDLQVSDYK